MRRVALVATLFLGLYSPSTEAKEVLTIYTYESFVADWGPGPKIKANFERDCDCTIKWVAVEDGVAILNRLKIEGSRTAADIALGLDNNIVAEAKELGIFAPHGMNASANNAPGWADDTFMPFDYGHFAVVYDTQSLKSPPRSLEELVEGNPEEKIILEDPRTSTPGLGFLLWMKAVYGDAVTKAWQKLRPRILTVTPGWSEAYGLFTKGEAPMVLSYTTSPAYHMIEENSQRYQAAEFAEGHYVEIEVAGMLLPSKHKDLATKFLKFMMSPGFQDTIPTTNWMYPAGTTSTPLPEAFGKLIHPAKTLQFTPEEVAEHRKAWTQEWLNATGG